MSALFAFEKELVDMVDKQLSTRMPDYSMPINRCQKLYCSTICLQQQNEFTNPISTSEYHSSLIFHPGSLKFFVKIITENQSITKVQ